MNVKLFMVSLAFKAFMRFDPCEFQFILGVNSWNYTVQILDAEWGESHGGDGGNNNNNNIEDL